VPAKAARALKRAQRTSLRATLVRHGLGEAGRRVVEAPLWYLLLRDSDECSTLEAAVALQQARRGVVVIPGGVTALVDALAEKFQQDGGQLRLGTPVDHLLVEGGRVRGLVTASGEMIRARWVITDVPPDVLAGSLLPRRHGWLHRHRGPGGPWRPARLMEAMVLAAPEALMPSELYGHCFVVPNPTRPAREENVVFVRTAAAWGIGEEGGGLRYLTVGRFVGAQSRHDRATVQGELLEALDEIVPGVGGAMVFHRELTAPALAELWGRPSAAVQYAAESRDWLGQRGLPHRLGWPGLLAVGEWTYPGRLVSNVVDGAMRVADLIARST
jgi:phytoene dehydrogenase-like protein